VSILAAYARANVSITDERDKCSFFDVGLYYYYFGKTFFWGIGSNDCQYVDSTCKPWFPVDKYIYHQSLFYPHALSQCWVVAPNAGRRWATFSLHTKCFSK
jgi:hypothetical protein